MTHTARRRLRLSHDKLSVRVASGRHAAIRGGDMQVASIAPSFCTESMVLSGPMTTVFLGASPDTKSAIL